MYFDFMKDLMDPSYTVLLEEQFKTLNTRLSTLDARILVGDINYKIHSKEK